MVCPVARKSVRLVKTRTAMHRLRRFGDRIAASLHIVNIATIGVGASVKSASVHQVKAERLQDEGSAEIAIHARDAECSTVVSSNHFFR